MLLPNRLHNLHALWEVCFQVSVFKSSIDFYFRDVCAVEFPAASWNDATGRIWPTGLQFDSRDIET